MKPILCLFTSIFFFACNNSNNDKQPGKENNPFSRPTTGDITSPGAATISYTVEDTSRVVRGLVIVKEDKDKLSPGNEHFAMISGSRVGGEHIVVNFVFAFRPGSYPIVGYSFVRTKQVFGGLLGGHPRLIDNKVNLTQCDDLGSNNMGGHKWRISGSIDGAITIPAMGIMKMDSTHPTEITVSKISFSNLSFDDNWEQMLEEGMKKLKGKSE